MSDEDDESYEFELEFTDVDIEHNVPPDLADTLEFEQGEVNIVHRDGSGNSTDQALTPSEKIEQLRCDDKNDGERYE